MNMVFIYGDDFIVDGDYSYLWIGDGWSVKVNDNTKTRYGAIRNELNGFLVTNLRDTFRGCRNLVNSPVISNDVTNMSGIFYGCINLEGNIKIDANNLQSTGLAFF